MDAISNFRKKLFRPFMEKGVSNEWNMFNALSLRRSPVIKKIGALHV